MTGIPPRVHFVALVGATAGASALEFSWRLLGSNNRELGRGSVSHPSLPEVLASIEHVRSGLDPEDVVHLRGAHTDGWNWVLRTQGRDLVHSARTFRRERESVYNADAFLAALPVADIRLPENDLKIPHVRAAVFLPLGDQPAGVAS